MTLPNPLPRPDDELQRLEKIWAAPKGWRFISVVNNNYIGAFYIGASMLFFVLAGILALLMRTQLAVPENDFLDHTTYNQFFTTHGTMMMFLFAVPAVEAWGIYLLPGMLAARDLPFPRLSAYAFWAYFIGGIVFFGSLFFELAPEGGWFMYPPLTSYPFSPGVNADFWLLGIGFIEISAIAGAIELIVGILRTRAPGMSLDKMPVYVWAMLVLGAMIVFAFPAVIAATALLELERAFHWPFFLAEKGGDPLLWQHLFWFFGHPEVYIIFLPAAGMVSMIVPTFARTPIAGYKWIVVALLGTGFLSFGLWVHHMFTTGIPQLSLSFFSAASMAVSVPSGIQVFSWIVTLARGKPQMEVPLLFILGFLFIFVLGGLTGVMVAVVPFDWQVHDSYFVVAHFHYVLIGGMVFPTFAAFYYWAPTLSGRKLSDRLGKWVFWLLFIGFNVTFFPMHATGLMGMPRRVYTYPAELGWGPLNMVSTIGAFIIAAGVLIFLIDLALNLRMGGGANPWKASTLEWLPMGSYAARSIPLIRSRDPLWDNPRLADEVQAGQHFLPRTATGRRETIVTSPIDAKPQFVVLIPGPSLAAVVAAAFTAFMFLGLTVKLVIPALLCGVVAMAAIIVWVWSTDPGPAYPPVDIGAGIKLPVYVTGPVSHSWWAMIVLLLVAGSLFLSIVFSYLFLWTVNPGDWPPEGVRLPSLSWPLLASLLTAASGGAVALASRLLRRAWAKGHWPVRLALFAAMPLLVAGVGVELYGHWQSGLRPTESSYAASVYAIVSLQGFFVATLLVMGLYTLARSAAGLLNAVRRATFDNTMLLWHYTVAQGLVALAVVHLFPRLVG